MELVWGSTFCFLWMVTELKAGANRQVVVAQVLDISGPIATEIVALFLDVVAAEVEAKLCCHVQFDHCPFVYLVSSEI